MTDKEKAQAYDEALDRMKYVVVVPKDKKALQALKETIFPELAESEDERIRKGLIELIENWNYPQELFTTKQNIIAYLKKQKEQEHPCDSAQFEEGFKTGYELGLRKKEEQKPVNGIDMDVSLTTNDGQSKLKAVGSVYDNIHNAMEQKPSEWSKDFEDNIRNLLHDKLTWHSEDGSMSTTVFIDNKTLKDIVSGIWFYVGKETLKYPNKEIHVSEWSEEDENNLELVIDCIYKFYPDPVMKYKLKEWLKSLRPVKQEWSEEDETMLRTIISDGSRGVELDSKQISWLKSLRPTKDCSSCAKHLEGYISGRSDAENKLLEQFGALITPEDELHIKPRWKPSEDEERLINTSISFLKDFADKGYENAVECIDWLKSKLNGNTCKQNESGSESHYPEHA